jgi:hypothetical protein
MTKIEKLAQALQAAQEAATQAAEKECKLIEANAPKKQREAAAKAAQAAQNKLQKATEKLQAAQAAHEAAAEASAQELKQAAAAEAKKFTPALVYIDRIRTQKSKMQSISRKFDLLVEVYEGAIDGARFVDFLDYMKMRHKIADKSTPKRGWSDYYALQFAEKYIKEAAADVQHIDHTKARAYLLNEKLKTQAEEAAEADYLARTK